MTARALATRTVIALILGTVLVVGCYHLVDRPVAWSVHEYSKPLQGFLRWPPLVSDGLKRAAPAAVVLVLLWWVMRPGGRLQTTLLAVSANLVLVEVLKHYAKRAAGRYWPETWEHPGNPSLIGSGEYGFHPFHGGPAYESFPSGHAAIVCAALSILWLSYPRWRWAYAIVGGAVCTALVGMNYHFVSDVIGGVLLGSITGVWMTRLFRLDRPESPAGDGHG